MLVKGAPGSIFICILKEKLRMILCMHRGITFSMCPGNERQCYNVMWALIGLAHTQNDPCVNCVYTVCGLIVLAASFGIVHMSSATGFCCSCTILWHVWELVGCYLLVLWSVLQPCEVNTLGQRQNGHYFPDDIFKCISWMKIYEFLLRFHWSLFLRV